MQLTVSDAGQGFDPTKVKPVGEVGGGFGLFSIRERLGLVGGTMEITSAPDRGSRFILMVPPGQGAVAELVEVAAEPMEVAEEMVGVCPPTVGARIRVLLADDHAVVREGLAGLLAQEPDIEIIGEAADGQEAVELAGRLLPDVILMDMSMPRLNGVEATRAIHNEFPDICIIGLSMFEEAERARALRDAGAINYLTKSGPSEDLVAAIRACMRGPSARPQRP